MAKPTIYIFHGDDEYAIKQEVTKLVQSFHDSAATQINVDRFDENNWDINAVFSATRSIPFLSETRVIILSNPLKNIRTKKDRESLLHILDTAPPTTILILQVMKPLTTWQERKKGKSHWLETWASEAGEKVYLHEFSQPRGHAMVTWITQTAAAMGGEISRPAAELLASLVAENPRIAAKELEKLLAYVNYQRKIDETDVETLVANEEQGNVFALVDAIGNRNKKQAIHLLHQILETEDPFLLFGMIVRQFRLIYLIKEANQKGYRTVAEIANAIHERHFVVQRILPQSHNFTLEKVKSIYRQLLEIDYAVKDGKNEWHVALETFVAELSF